MNTKDVEHPYCISTQETAEALKALGHPVRLQMIRELFELHTCCCAEMCKCFPQSQSTISQHLSVLKEAGLIRVEKNGNKSCFSLNHDALKTLQNALNELFPQESTTKHD